MLANATVPILGAVDTGVVGHMGLAAPIGAVGIGAMILSALYWIFGFLRMGTTGLTAQARGEGDQAEVAAFLLRALLIGGAGGLLLVLLQAPLFALAFQAAPASPEVESLARAYMSIRIWSVTGWLIAQERTRAVLLLQLWMNGLNIALDLWFVVGLGWGAPGVAFATFLAEWSGLALGLALCRDAFRLPDGRRLSRLFDRLVLRRMMAVNGDIMIRSALLQGIMVSFLFLAAGYGDEMLAANQVLLQFLVVGAYVMDGFAFAAEALTGQVIGARARGGVRRVAVLSGVWALGCAVALGLGTGLLGGAVIDAMTTAPELRAVARSFLPWVVIAPLLAAPSFLLDGIFIGATRTRDMRNMMVLSALAYAGALLLFLPWGNHGLWAALMVSYVARGVTLGVRYPALERG